VLNDAVEPRKHRLYITHKVDGSSDSALRPRCTDTAQWIYLRLQVEEEDEVSYCGGNELVLETCPPYTHVRETVAIHHRLN